MYLLFSFSCTRFFIIVVGRKSFPTLGLKEKVEEGWFESPLSNERVAFDCRPAGAA